VHNETIVTWEHPVGGTIRQTRHPVRFSSGETPVPEWVPVLGEPIDEVLSEIGKSADQIAALREAAVVT
jgi:formyl-CoA transferase